MLFSAKPQHDQIAPFFIILTDDLFVCFIESSGSERSCGENSSRSVTVSQSACSSGADSGVDSYDLPSIGISLCGGLTENREITKGTQHHKCHLVSSECNLTCNSVLMSANVYSFHTIAGRFLIIHHCVFVLHPNQYMLMHHHSFRALPAAVCLISAVCWESLHHWQPKSGGEDRF